MKIRPTPVASRRLAGSAGSDKESNGNNQNKTPDLFEKRRFYLPWVMSEYRPVEAGLATQKIESGRVLYTALAGELMAPVATPGDLAALMALYSAAPARSDAGAGQVPEGAQKLVDLRDRGVKSSLPLYQVYLQQESRWPLQSENAVFTWQGLTLKQPAEDLSVLEPLSARVEKEPYQALMGLARHFGSYKERARMAVSDVDWSLSSEARELFLGGLQRVDHVEQMQALFQGDFEENAQLLVHFDLLPGRAATTEISKLARRIGENNSAATLIELKKTMDKKRLRESEQLQRLGLLEQLGHDTARARLLLGMVETGFDGERSDKFLKLVARPVKGTQLEDRVRAFERLIEIKQPPEPLRVYSTMEALYTAYSAAPDRLEELLAFRDTVIKDRKELGPWVESWQQHGDPAHRKLLHQMLNQGFHADKADHFLSELKDQAAIEVFVELVQLDGEMKSPLNQYEVMEGLLSTFTEQQELGFSREQALERSKKLREVGGQRLDRVLKEYRKEESRDLDTLLAWLEQGWDAAPAAAAARHRLATPSAEFVEVVKQRDSSDQGVFIELLAQHAGSEPLLQQMVEKSFHSKAAVDFMQLLADQPAEIPIEERRQLFAEVIKMDDLKAPLSTYKVMESLYRSFSAAVQEGIPKEQAATAVVELRETLLQHQATAADFEAVFGAPHSLLLEKNKRMKEMLAGGWDIPFSAGAVEVLSTAPDADVANQRLQYLKENLSKVSQDQRLEFVRLLPGLDEPRFGLFQKMVATGYDAEHAGKFLERVSKPLGITSSAQRVAAFERAIGIDKFQGAFNQYAVMEAAYAAFSHRIESGADPEATVAAVESFRQRVEDTNGKALLAGYPRWAQNPDQDRLVVAMTKTQFSAEAMDRYLEQVGRPIGGLSEVERGEAFLELTDLDNLRQPLSSYESMDSLLRNYTELVQRGQPEPQARALVIAAREQLLRSGVRYANDFVARLQPLQGVGRESTEWLSELLASDTEVMVATAMHRGLHALTGIGRSETEAKDFLLAFVQRELARSGQQGAIRALEDAISTAIALAPPKDTEIEFDEDLIQVGDHEIGRS